MSACDQTVIESTLYDIPVCIFHAAASCDSMLLVPTRDADSFGGAPVVAGLGPTVSGGRINGTILCTAPDGGTTASTLNLTIRCENQP